MQLTSSLRAHPDGDRDEEELLEVGWCAPEQIAKLAHRDGIDGVIADV